MSVRLVGGLSDAEGRVEINYQGTWGTVCNDSSWGLNDAMVVCGMLGYTSVLAAHVKYGQGSGTVWMSNLACTGSESSISECPHIGWGETSCSHSQDAGVTCGRKYSSTPSGIVYCYVTEPLGPLTHKYIMTVYTLKFQQCTCF